MTDASTNAEALARDINLVSSFLAHAPNSTLEQINPSIIVICGSAVLHTVSVTFSYLQQVQTRSQSGQQQQHQTKPRLHTVVIAGGIGHSTTHIYHAVKRHAKYGTYFRQTDEHGQDRCTGKPEAVIFDDIRREFFPTTEPGTVKVLIEDKSTNCGANADFARKVLEEHGVFLGGTVSSPTSNDAQTEDVVIVQDPTMSLRTLKCFEKTYADVLSEPSRGNPREGPNVRFHAYPTFTPLVRPRTDGASSEDLVWDDSPDAMKDVEDVDGLWDMKRFNGLILGEIPRLRDDENGYGPKGKGFIGHVDIPTEVEEAWQHLEAVLEVKR